VQTLATILDVGASGQLSSFAQFVRERHTDLLADWQARVLAARGQVDSRAQNSFRHLLDYIIASTTGRRRPLRSPQLLAKHTPASLRLASNAVTDYFLFASRDRSPCPNSSEAGSVCPNRNGCGTRSEGASRLATELVTARILESEKRHQATESRQRFLQEASQLLAETLDYESTLTTIARLAVPSISDWCIIDVLRRDGTLSRVATEQKDPARAELASELHRNPPKRRRSFRSTRSCPEWTNPISVKHL
jgi:hypothetical protein